MNADGPSDLPITAAIRVPAVLILSAGQVRAPGWPGLDRRRLGGTVGFW